MKSTCVLASFETVTGQEFDLKLAMNFPKVFEGLVNMIFIENQSLHKYVYLLKINYSYKCHLLWSRHGSTCLQSQSLIRSREEDRKFEVILGCRVRQSQTSCPIPYFTLLLIKFSFEHFSVSFSNHWVKYISCFRLVEFMYSYIQFWMLSLIYSSFCVCAHICVCVCVPRNRTEDFT